MANSAEPKHKYEVNLEEFTLVWLDANVNKDNYNVEAQKRLRTYMNHLRTFDDPDECRKYVTEVPHNRPMSHIFCHYRRYTAVLIITGGVPAVYRR